MLAIFIRKLTKPNQDHGFQPQFKKNTLTETTFYAIFQDIIKKDQVEILELKNKIPKNEMTIQ